MAQAAQIPGADLIPDTAELFLGFTSTQRAGMGPGAIANFETLGYVDLRGSDYFRQGTHMHLSHIHEDVEAWYLNFDFDERVVDGVPAEPRRAGRDADRAGRARSDVSTEADVQPRLPALGPDRSQRVDPDDLAAADAITSRADGTLREGSRDPGARRLQHARQPVRVVGARPTRSASCRRAGVHFVVFNPTGDDFHRNRLAMDGVLPDGTIAVRAARPRPGLQLGALDDAPAELPRAAAAAPQLPAQRAAAV